MNRSAPASRRRFLQHAGAAVLLVGVGAPRLTACSCHDEDALAASAGRFALPGLDYAPEDLPGFDPAAFRLHHSGHHAAHVRALNEALAERGLAPKHLRDVLAALADDPDPVLRHHAGAHAAHTLYWTSLSPTGGGEPPATVATALARDFGSVADFRNALRTAALGVFGSGWVWLIRRPDGRLAVTTTANEDHPWMTGLVADTGEPLLALDVAEHAYYLQHQNRRADYVTACLDALNWSGLARRLGTSNVRA